MAALVNRSDNLMMVESLYADLPSSIYMEIDKKPFVPTRNKIIAMLYELADGGLLGKNPLMRFFREPPCNSYTSIFINCKSEECVKELLNDLREYTEQVRVVSCRYYGLVETAISSMLLKDKSNYFDEHDLAHVEKTSTNINYAGGEIKRYTCALKTPFITFEFDVPTVFHIYVLLSEPVKAKNFLRELILMPKVLPGLSTNDLPKQMLSVMNYKGNGKEIDHPVLTRCKSEWVITSNNRVTFKDYSKTNYEEFTLHKRNDNDQNAHFAQERRDHYENKRVIS
ncbi:MAG: hypothetical protein FJX92_08900 [Bacteroidetes bacterium]|nr:hypothetical protein [Bacteroidota bacterium]